MAHADNHGHSLASWTAVVIELVAAALIGLGIAVPAWNWLVLPGVVLVVAGLVAWRLLAAAGHGDRVRQGPRIEGR